MNTACLKHQDRSYGTSYINSGTLTEYNFKCSNTTACMATHMHYIHIRAQTYMNARMCPLNAWKPRLDSRSNRGSEPGYPDEGF